MHSVFCVHIFEHQIIQRVLKQVFKGIKFGEVVAMLFYSKTFLSKSFPFKSGTNEKPEKKKSPSSQFTREQQIFFSLFSIPISFSLAVCGKTCKSLKFVYALCYCVYTYLLY